MKLIILRFFLSALLFIAVLDLPYVYYQALRIIVPLGISLIIFVEYDKLSRYSIFLYVSICVLFNPILPIYLLRETWFYLDLLSGVVILILSFTDKKIGGKQ
jgi:hypothetical protein